MSSVSEHKINAQYSTDVCCQIHDPFSSCVSLFFQAKYNVLSGNYPISTKDALTLGGILAYIENGNFDPEVHTSGAFK